MKIFLDYDSTLVNLEGPWLDYVNKKFDVNLSSMDIKTWTWVGDTYGECANDFFRAQGIYRNDTIKPIPGSLELVRSLQKLVGNDNVHIISYVQEGQGAEKKEHAKRHFNVDNFISSKEKYLHTGKGILVDDNPNFVLEHANWNKSVGILFNLNDSYGWARLDDTHQCKLVKKCTSYDSIIETIESFQRD
jgi:5'(3')-deoxyribonucleotidase